MEKRGLEAANQLNRFVDDLRKELVFNRLKIVNSEKEISSLHAQLNERNREISQLRQHAIDEEKENRNIIAELEKRINANIDEINELEALVKKSDKDTLGKKEARLQAVIDSQEGIIGQKTAEIATLQGLLKAKKGISIDARHQLAKQNIDLDGIKRQLFEREQEIEGLKPSRNVNESAVLLKKEVIDKTRQIDHLREHMSRQEELSQQLTKAFEQQIMRREEEINQLQQAVIDKTNANERLGRQLEKSFLAKDETLERIKKRFVEKDEASQQLYRQLTEQLAAKDEETEHLRKLLFKKDDEKDSQRYESRVLEKEKEIFLVKEEIKTRDDELQRLSEQFSRQTEEKNRQIAVMQQFVEEKESLKKKLEEQFNRLLAEKNAEIRILKEIRKKSGVSEKTRQLIEIREKTNTKLQQQIKEKEEAIAHMAEEVMDAQNLAKLQVQRYNELLEEQQKSSHEKMKQAIREHTEKEIMLRNQVSQLASQMAEQAAMLKEKEQNAEQQISLAVKEFQIKAQQMLALKGNAAEIKIEIPETILAKQKELAQKEKDVQELLKEAEEKIIELKKKEQEISVKEELLLREQDALKKELEILEEAGMDLRRARAHVETQESAPEYELPEPAMPEPAPVIEEQIEAAVPIPAVRKPAPIKTLPSRKQAKPALKTKQKIKEKKLAKKLMMPAGKHALMKPAALLKKALKAGTPKTSAMQLRKPEPLSQEKQRHIEEANQLFSGEREGFSEQEEIMSIIDMALQNNETAEQIRASLLSSGYSKDAVEKAIRSVKTVK